MPQTALATQLTPRRTTEASEESYGNVFVIPHGRGSVVALDTDRDLRRYDLLAKKLPPGMEHQSVELSLTLSDGKN